MQTNPMFYEGCPAGTIQAWKLTYLIAITSTDVCTTHQIFKSAEQALEFAKYLTPGREPTIERVFVIDTSVDDSPAPLVSNDLYSKLRMIGLTSDQNNNNQI